MDKGREEKGAGQKNREKRTGTGKHRKRKITAACKRKGARAGRD